MRRQRLSLAPRKAFGAALHPAFIRFLAFWPVPAQFADFSVRKLTIVPGEA